MKFWTKIITILLLLTDNIWAIDDTFCPQTKKIITWMIQDTYNQMMS